MVNRQRPEDSIEAQEPDVEGHGRLREALPTDQDDTEGHRLRQADQSDEDDVEGHGGRLRE